MITCCIQFRQAIQSSLTHHRANVNVRMQSSTVAVIPLPRTPPTVCVFWRKMTLLAQDDTSNLQQMRLLVLINLKFITLVIHSKRSIATVYSACKDRSRIRLLCLLFKRSMQPSNRPLQITPKLYSRGRVTRSTCNAPRPSGSNLRSCCSYCSCW